jgi:tetratricopeptide (TPR) repeat protein
VDIQRHFASANPAAFEPDLAGALNNLGSRLSELGRSEPALAATEEALEIFRRLADASPGAFESDLARALLNYSWVRAAVRSQLAEAVLAAQKSIDICAELVRRLPETFSDDLVGARRMLADVLVAQGRKEDADELRGRRNSDTG